MWMNKMNILAHTNGNDILPLCVYRQSEIKFNNDDSFLWIIRLFASLVNSVCSFESD